jgi:hypothetical protein
LFSRIDLGPVLPLKNGFEDFYLVLVSPCNCHALPRSRSLLRERVIDNKTATSDNYKDIFTETETTKISLQKFMQHRKHTHEMGL